MPRYMSNTRKQICGLLCSVYLRVCVLGALLRANIYYSYVIKPATLQHHVSTSCSWPVGWCDGVDERVLCKIIMFKYLRHVISYDNLHK